MIIAATTSSPRTLIWRKNKASLYRYIRETAPTRRTPVFLVLPLINRAYILDLRPGSSFVEHLLGQRRRAPRGRNAGGGQQVLGAVGNAVQRSAVVARG